jgi:hypothetical protein
MGSGQQSVSIRVSSRNSFAHFPETQWLERTLHTVNDVHMVPIDVFMTVGSLYPTRPLPAYHFHQSPFVRLHIELQQLPSVHRGESSGRSHTDPFSDANRLATSQVWFGLDEALCWWGGYAACTVHQQQVETLIDWMSDFLKDRIVHVDPRDLYTRLFSLARADEMLGSIRQACFGVPPVWESVWERYCMNQSVYRSTTPLSTIEAHAHVLHNQRVMLHVQTIRDKSKGLV